MSDGWREMERLSQVASKSVMLVPLKNLLHLHLENVFLSLCQKKKKITNCVYSELWKFHQFLCWESSLYSELGYAQA